METKDLNIDFPIPSFPINEDDVRFETEMPANCQILQQKDSQGNPIINCDFIGGDYDEWVADRGKPFASDGGCELS